MRPHKGEAMTGKHAWAIMAAAILVYELQADDEELLSSVVDEWLITHPVITRFIIAAVSLHLANLLPWQSDPLTLTKQLRRAIYAPK